MTPGRGNRIILGWIAGIPIVFALLLFSWKANWLPHPERASRTQLLHWLATRDLGAEKDSVKASLLQRLEDEYFAKSSDLPEQDRLVETYIRLDPQSRLRWRLNLDQLTELWIRSRVERLHSHPDQRHELMVQAVEEGLGHYHWFASHAGNDFRRGKIDSESSETEGLMMRMAVRTYAPWFAEAMQRWLAMAEVQSLHPLAQHQLASTLLLSYQSCTEPQIIAIQQQLASESWFTTETQQRQKANIDRLLTDWLLDRSDQWQSSPDQHREALERDIWQDLLDWHAWLVGESLSSDPQLERSSQIVKALEQRVAREQRRAPSPRFAPAKELVIRLQDRAAAPQSRGSLSESD